MVRRRVMELQRVLRQDARILEKTQALTLSTAECGKSSRSATIQLIQTKLYFNGLKRNEGEGW